MVKRELLLIGAFAAAGAAVWWLTAPPGKPGQEGFSFSRMVQHIRADLRGYRVPASVRRSARFEPGPGLETLAIDGFTGAVSVLGEERPDVVVELEGTAYGADEADAAARVARVAHDLKPMGDTRHLTVTWLEARSRTRVGLQISLPRRLGVVVSNARGNVDLHGVASSDLETRAGNVSIRDVAGRVTGSHRDGRVEIVRAGEVSYAIRRGDTSIEAVTGDLACEATDGRLSVKGVGGTTTLKARRLEADLERLDGRVQVDAADGRIDLRGPGAEVNVEGERTRFSLTLAAAVPVTVRASDEPVEVTLAKGTGADLDLDARSGTVSLPDESIPVERTDEGQRVKVAFAGGGPPLVVRTERADVIIRR
jgi:hypothetical protein